MKKLIVAVLGTLFLSNGLHAQEIFEGISKGFYRKVADESDKITIPQFSINFETYSETKVVVQEGKLSKLQNVFDAASKGGQYGGNQSASARTTTILNSNLEMSDFQQLANDFQQILEEEITKAGKTVLPLNELTKTEGYAKMQEKFSSKTENKGKNNSDAKVGVGQIKMFPENSLFLFDEKSLSKGGVPFVTMMRNFNKETGAVVLLNNIDIDFSTVELNVSLDAGTKRSVTTADTKVIPKMRISRNTFDLIGKGGSANLVPATLMSEYVSGKEYSAKIYKDTAKSKSLLEGIFAIGVPNIDFDPFIVEMSKETYMQSARDLFRQYAQDFAKALVTSGGK